MDIIDLKAWINEAARDYRKKQIMGVYYCSDLQSYIFTLRNTSLWISVHPKYPYIDITDTETSCSRHTLSNNLKDTYIKEIHLINADLVLKILLGHKYIPSNEKHLYVEMQRNKTNLILTDKMDRILYVHREIENKRYGRRLWAGSIYTMPPTAGTISIDEVLSISQESPTEKIIIRGIAKERRKNFSDTQIYQLWNTDITLATFQILDNYLHIIGSGDTPIPGSFYEHYITILEIDHQKRLAAARMKELKKEKKKLEKLLEKLREEYKSTEGFEKYKLFGDGILAFMSEPVNSDTFTFTDWNTGKEITVEVTPGEDPSTLARKYYNKYKHLKKKRENVRRRIAEIEEKLSKLSAKEISETEKENIEKGRPYHKYEDEYGNIYLVGKNSIGNQIVTFKLASKRHLWFHVKDFPGSHVILKPKDSIITEYAIITAAKLASHFSKKRESSKVEVIYTEKKNVKPIKGQPGMVTYRREKSIVVAPESPEEMEMKKL